jgi:tryptophan-rich sensory protein
VRSSLPLAGKRIGVARLIANVVVVVAIAGALDATIRSFGWNQPRGEVWPAFAPPGAAIGAIWVALFACMAAARYVVARSGSREAAGHARAIVALMVVCLAYPIYTHVFHGHLTELVGNVVSFALATTIVFRVATDSTVASVLIALVSAWIAFATVLVFALVTLNGWTTA